MSFYENWIHRKIRQATSKPDVTRANIEALQLDRLNRTIRYAKANSPFYGELLAGIGEISCLDDLEGVPFTTAEDLATQPYRLLCLSQSKIARTFCHFTTGTTTGRPKKVFFTHTDANNIVDSMASIMASVFDSVGIDPAGRTVHIFLPNNGPPMSMAGLISRGAEQIGAVPVVGDCTAMTPQQIEQIAEVRPQMLMGSAFRIWRITQEGRQIQDLASIGVKALFITSEYLSKPMRWRLEDYWQAEVFHHYGMTEPGFVVGVECRAHDGFHFNETQLLYEVVDPETGWVLPDGEEGELVLTTLQREGMPLIRYRTGDIASLCRDPCPCGATTLSRIGTLPKRASLMVTIGEEEEIYTSLFDETLYEVPELIDYRVFVSHSGGKDIIHCKVELLEQPSGVEEDLVRRIMTIPPVKRAVESGLADIPYIELVGRGVLRRGGRRMKRRIVDERV